MLDPTPQTFKARGGVNICTFPLAFICVKSSKIQPNTPPVQLNLYDPDEESTHFRNPLLIYFITQRVDMTGNNTGLDCMYIYVLVILHVTLSTANIQTVFALDFLIYYTNCAPIIAFKSERARAILYEHCREGVILIKTLIGLDSKLPKAYKK